MGSKYPPFLYVLTIFLQMKAHDEVGTLLRFSAQIDYLSVGQFCWNKVGLLVGFERFFSHLGTDAPLNGCVLRVRCRFRVRGILCVLLVFSETSVASCKVDSSSVSSSTPKSHKKSLSIVFVLFSILLSNFMFDLFCLYRRILYLLLTHTADIKLVEVFEVLVISGHILQLETCPYKLLYSPPPGIFIVKEGTDMGQVSVIQITDYPASKI